MVNMAMATKFPKESDNNKIHDDNQNHILDQLLTSLYTTLNQFNIATENYYPTECTNCIAGHSESTTCHTHLLVAHRGCLCPIKLFLTVSFAKYLA
jgi:hypothetical protein